MMNYNLFLDDFRHPYDCIKYMKLPIYSKLEWIIVRNYGEFVDYIAKKGLPKIISFDHDLADEHYSPEMYRGSYNAMYKNFKEKTGLDCAKWLVDYCADKDLDLPEYLVHSMNPAGRKNISSYLENYEKFRKK